MSLIFCPQCSNLLLVERATSDESSMQFYCQTCPYVYLIDRPLEKVLPLQRKKVDDVLSVDYDHQEQTEAQCDKCGNKKAYFYQLQTRSADEPMTIFYTCTMCKFKWKDG